MTYYQPTSLDQALQLKAKLGKASTLLAGGTDVVVGIRKGRAQVVNFIDLSHVPGLDEVVEQDGHLTIGAMTTHARLETCSQRAVALAARTIGGPQIRNVGTVGGQIGTASPAGDLTTALIALRAEVELVSGPRGARRLPLDELFVAPGKTKIADDEIVRTVYVPLGRRSDFYKIGKRRAVAISVVMAAVSIGAAGDVGIGLGCVAPVPLRCRRAEKYLADNGLDRESIIAAGKLAAEEVSPITDHRGGTSYRRAMARTLTERLLRSFC